MTQPPLPPKTPHTSRRRLNALPAACLASGLILLIASPATAQTLGAQGANPLTLVALMAALSMIPFLFVLMTSFIKVAVVLSLLRTAIGAQQVPPNQVITGLAIVLSIYIMAPVGLDTYQIIEPVIERVERQEQTVDMASMRAIAQDASVPIRGFLLKHADPGERELLYELAMELRSPEQREELTAEDLIIAVPAFVLTELKEAFMIGFLLFVPFLIVDLVVANILLSLGMHMLSPTTVSLPFKLLLFVVVDGWYLVVKGLILGYL